MDLAVYINELLGTTGEVNVPGIGHFVHLRINGYYHQRENKFYPPTHKINFDPEFISDQSLASYISEKKNISLASSKYFIEKYVNGLKQQIATELVDIAGLGHLYLNGSSIGFNEDSRSKDRDPAFFGFKPIDLQSFAQIPVTASAPPVPKQEERAAPAPLPEPVATALINDRIPPAPPKSTVIEESEQPEEQEYAPEEIPRRNNNNTWVAILLILIIALLALMGLYKYKPEWFDRSKDKPQTFVAVDSSATGTQNKPAGADTTKKVVVQQDTTAKTVAKAVNPPSSASIDTGAMLHYEILGGAFKALDQANGIEKKYQTLGLKPRILKHNKGKNYIITLGTYFAKDQAQKVEDSIASVTKLKPGTDIYLQTYKPKQ